MVASIKPLIIGGAGGLMEQSVPDLIQLGDTNAYLTGQLNILPSSSSPSYNNSLSFLDAALQVKGSIGKTFPDSDTFNVIANSGDLFLENGNGDDLLITIGQMLFNGDPVAVESDSGLLTLSYVNFFSASGLSPARYRKIGNWVIVSGTSDRVVSDTALDSVVMATLPVGFRPLRAVPFLAVVVGSAANAAAQRLHLGFISPDGTINRGTAAIRTGTAYASSNTSFCAIYRID